MGSDFPAGFVIVAVEETGGGTFGSVPWLVPDEHAVRVAIAIVVQIVFATAIFEAIPVLHVRLR
ncbi:hypothetical protein ACFQ9X_42670 [Catenulispora yoronensis]